MFLFFLETDGAHLFNENNLHKILTIHVITKNELCRLDRSIRLKGGILAYQKLFRFCIKAQTRLVNIPYGRTNCFNLLCYEITHTVSYILLFEIKRRHTYFNIHVSG